MRRTLAPLCLSFALATTGCGSAEEPVEYEQPFTSDVATLLDFEFDGQLTAASTNTRGLVRAQLLYTVGSLNDHNGVARLERLVLSNVSYSYLGNGLYRHKYHAKLPVAWGSKTNLPTAFTFTLPQRADAPSSFTNKYGQSCSDAPSDVTVNNFWYHYRPEQGGCSFSTADVTTMSASVRVSTLNSVAKYPEYQKVWEDGALNILAVFGKYAVGGTDESDAGIAAYDEFIRALRAEYPNATTTPATLPPGPGVAATDVTFQLTTANGDRISVTALLVDSVPSAGTAFIKRYNELSTGADLIMYNGHAGLGANVRYLQTIGKYFPGKYQIIFMDGCDTFAYYDETIPKARALVNPDDPSGTKYLDMVTNAMPAYFVSLADSTMALIRALAAPTAPKSWGTIFRNVDPSQVAVVTGEEDNVFTPSYNPGPLWNGFAAKGQVGYKQTLSWKTETLQPGTYVFASTPETSNSSGDADLRIRVGAPPELTSTYKCKSYVANSNELCKLTLTSPGQVYIAVTGDSTAVARFNVDAWQLP